MTALPAWLGPHLAVVAAIAYFLGSIPFGLIISRLGGAGDIRKVGSGNIGATNVLRTGRKGLAASTLLLDALKGVAAVLIARWITAAYTDYALGVAAFMAVFGHCFPIWLGFRGGKGVATGLGVTIALSPLTGAAACLVWLAVAKLAKISSAGALCAFALIPILLPAISEHPVYSPEPMAAAGYAILIFIRHYGNIVRLLRGEERHINIDPPAQRHLDV
jgi:acyl phosphate:glycerol-3-phosphate acyltransferase